MTNATARVPTEFTFKAAQRYADIFNEIEVDVVFKGPDGISLTVPAFWAGRDLFIVRFGAPKAGRYSYRTVCTNPQDAGLHDQKGEFKVAPYKGKNPLYRHGRLRVAASRRTLEHEDGTPFFWLGDTWWMSLCKRFTWPRDFHALDADRVSKGFNVIQIIAGLYPDMPAFDKRGANEAGFPWDKNYTRINPAYFDKADVRIAYLVQSGLLPCIVACWGYFAPWMGAEKLKKHWRNLVARYGAYPVAWCLAGEAAMPYYLSTKKDQEVALQKKIWTELARYVRAIDGYHNPITIHPTDKGRNQVDDPSVLDFDMMQTGHGDRQTLPNHVSSVVESYAREPRMPMFVAETCYEGFGDGSHEEVQHLMFWSSVLSGACGHTYGANGIWQVNTKKKPYGPSPHGLAWGNRPWDEAAQLPGSRHLGISKRLLERYPWWNLEPHPEWIEPHWSKDNYGAPYAAGIPGRLMIAYFPSFPWCPVKVKGLEPSASYRAFLFDPATGDRYPKTVHVNDAGEWEVQPMPGHPLHLTFPLFQDWVLVVEKR